MIRQVPLVVAVLAIGAVVAAPAHAGGGNTKGATKVGVRFKNIGAQPVQVNAQSGSTASGGVPLAQNGFYQADVSPGAFTAVAKGINTGFTQTLHGSASKNPIYLTVKADDKATTITVVPAF